MIVQPYLLYDGRCEEALAFYEKAVGAEIEAKMRYKEAPEKPPPGMLQPGSDDKIMHSSMRIGGSVVMAADDCMGGRPRFGGFSLTITSKDEAEARRAFDALAQGGQVKMPLGRTFFSPCFGMLEDKFGVGWMVMVPE